MIFKLIVPRFRKSFLSTMVQTISHVQEAALNEKCILVNERDKVIGEASKKDCHSISGKGLLLHRAFSVFLFNSKNELLLQKRSDSKVTFPGFVSNTCCSHPLHDIVEERIEPGGLGVKLAAIRRMNHELGIPQDMVAPEDLHYITRVLYKLEDAGPWGEYELDYILLMKKDLPLKPNPEEVSKVIYVARDNFDKFLKENADPFSPWFNLIIENGLRTWWNNIDNIDHYKDHVTIHRFDK